MCIRDRWASRMCALRWDGHAAHDGGAIPIADELSRAPMEDPEIDPDSGRIWDSFLTGKWAVNVS